MKRNFLGNTGIEVTELSLGTLILGKLQTDMSPEESIPTIQMALELGINFFDTAQGYATQNHLRVGLGREVNNVVLATKTHAKTLDEAKEAVEESLRELGRNMIDIYHLHLIRNAEDMQNRRAILDYFLELKEKGVIRAVAASAHCVEAVRAIADVPEIDIAFPVLNSRGLGIPDGSAEDMIQACEVLKKQGRGLYAMKPLAGGHLRNDPQAAFGFLRETGIFDSICAGMKSPTEVEMNTAIFENRDISREVLSQVDTITRSLKIYDLCIGCGACVKTCAQEALTIDYSQTDESKGKKGQSVVDQDKCILCGYCVDTCPKFCIRVI